MSPDIRSATSSDGVAISYSVAGDADTALLFLHGGLADHSFWDGQMAAFRDRFRVVAPDLAGHGQSGRNRAKWGIAAFAQDALAVLDAERIERVILVGNSLGGAVAIEAGAIAGKRVLGVIGVDTFHDFGRVVDPSEAAVQAEAWRNDFEGSLERMLKALFHADADPALVADVRRRMRHTSTDTVYAIFRSFAGYDTAASARGLRVPVRSINGDLFPTDVGAIRKVVADFDLIVMPDAGHFPMLERPEEFNWLLARVAGEIA